MAGSFLQFKRGDDVTARYKPMVSLQLRKVRRTGRNIFEKMGGMK
jgi:hypothetical protein